MKLRNLLAAIPLLALAMQCDCVVAQKKYAPGASDTEIKIGNTMPYSGPASAWGTFGRSASAYFDKVNAEGGVNGRKLVFISLDDGYSPPRTVEMTRRLVEQDRVLLLFWQLGTATNTAIHKYVNANKIPHLFVATNAEKWADPAHYPWTIGFGVSYQSEGQIYAKHILLTKPGTKIGVLYQNDDFGKDYLKGLKDGLGAQAAKMIVKELTYEVADPTVDSQIIALKESGADIFVNVTNAKAAAQAIRKAYDIGWKPAHYLIAPASSISSTLIPAGVEKAVGILSAVSGKDPRDPQWANDPGMKGYFEFMKKYYPKGDPLDGFNVGGYSASQTLVQVLRQCGDNLTRENVMRQAASLKKLQLPLMLPGITVNTSPTDFHPLKEMQMRRFDGKQWALFGEVLGH
jgi:ABC-type branched-subunit amino acid transport system substrate-binding protein